MDIKVKDTQLLHDNSTQKIKNNTTRNNNTTLLHTIKEKQFNPNIITPTNNSAS